MWPLNPSTINPLNNSVNESLSTTLNWTQINGADKYQIQLSDFDDFRSFILNKETNLNSISVNNLKSLSSYGNFAAVFGSMIIQEPEILNAIIVIIV